MGQFMIRRTFYAVITLFILSLTIFTVVRLTGDPVTLMAEPGAQEADLALVRAEWGLDRPLPLQYAAFLRNIVTGELGQSFNYEMPVSTLYFQRLPNSLELALAATLISFLIGIPAGIVSAMRVNSAWDQVGKTIALLGLSDSGILARVGDDPGVLGMARMAADQRTGRLAQPRHAGDRPRLVFCRVAAAPHPFQHARGAAQRIHQAGAAEGAAGVRGDRACTRSRTLLSRC